MKVFILGGNFNYRRMFNNLGLEVVDDVTLAEFICFTGGSDVSPELYGEDKHPRTFNNDKRDAEEVSTYKYALNKRIPMVGICRGAQFLHVMNGGSLYQDVDNHAIYGTHEATDVLTGDVVNVTSTHHQMMRHVGEGELVCKATLSSRKEVMLAGVPVKMDDSEFDIEAIWHSRNNCLCFQPHPEFEGADSTYLYFKNLMGRYFNAS